MATPPRVVTVWCPEWSVFAAGATAEQPAAVFRANRVVARTPAAAQAGVASGARRRAAQRACPDLLILDHDPDRDAREFEPVVRAVADMAPRLEVVEPGWLCLNALGPSRYFGGDEALSRRLVEVTYEASRVSCRVAVGVADGRSTSAIAARRAAQSSTGYLVVEPSGSGDFVAPIRVVALRELGEISAELVDLFVRLGLRTLGDLALLDAGDVLSRFGVEGLHAHRLAVAADERHLAATDPPPEWWVEQVFSEPVEQLETVVFIAKRLADDLAERLAGDGRVCVRLMVTIETEHGERNTRAWYRYHGMSAPAMVERVRWQLEGWVGQGLSGGITLLRLTPDEVRSDDGVQAGLWGGRSRADHDAERAIVRLSALVGEQGVCVPEWAGGRLPSERYRFVPASSVELDDSSGRLDRGVGPWPGSLSSPSPSIVLHEPLPVELLDDDGNSVRVSGRGEIGSVPSVLAVGNVRHRVEAWAGPWPVEQRWWASDMSQRLARLQVVTSDGAAHLVGIEQQRWLMLATYG